MVARVNNTDMITFARIVAQETRTAVMDGVLAGEEQKTKLLASHAQQPLSHHFLSLNDQLKNAVY